jgi:GH24 family phage-related lysozyme (muramidase)
MVNQQTAATQADQQTIENQSDYSNTVASTQADQQAVENQTQQTEIMTIEDHPIHGSFDIEIPASYTDEQASRYVDGLDLDLLLGMPQKKGKDNKDLGVTNVEQLKEWENSVGSGKRGDKWFTHDSLEGGTPTIAYGSKLTQEEYDTGKMKIGDKLVNWRSGITEEQAQARLNQDAGSAKQVALAALTKANMADDPNKVSALTSLIYNVGSGAWAKSKAKKYLETGRIEDFMYEAFSPEVGFVKVNGEVSRGLVRRRAAEAQLFGEGNIGQGGGFGSMMSEVLSKLNPISSAQASERTPQDQQMAQAVQDANTTLGKLGGVNVPVKPDVPAVTTFDNSGKQVGDAITPAPNPEKVSTSSLSPVEAIKKFGIESINPISVAHASELSVSQGGSPLTPEESSVVKLQKLLEMPVIDGKMGGNTLNAIKKFQADNGLLVDGVAGPATMKKLEKKQGIVNTVLDSAAETAKSLFSPKEVITKEESSFVPDLLTKIIRKTTILSVLPDNLELFVTDLLFKNILGVPLGGTVLTESDLNSENVDLASKLALTAIQKGKSSVSYPDYPLSKRGLPVEGIVGGKGRESADAVYSLSPQGLARIAYDVYTDPAVTLATTLGGFSLKKEGDVYYITDTYDAEKFVHGSGSKGFYGKMRNLLSDYGTTEQQDKKDDKIKFKIKLGTLKELEDKVANQ